MIVKAKKTMTATYYYKEDDFLAEGSYDQGYLDLVSKEFEGNTEDDVKMQVEQWGQEQMNEILSVLRKHFNK